MFLSVFAASVLYRIIWAAIHSCMSAAGSMGRSRPRLLDFAWKLS